MDAEQPEDHVAAGNAMWRTEDYRLINGGLDFLLHAVANWNGTAIAHGALQPPYRSEQEVLASMVAFGNKALATGRTSVSISGISVGSLRFIKAGLLASAWRADAEVDEASDAGGWPAKVAEAVRGRARRCHELAAQIKHMPAPILEELRPEMAFRGTPESSTAAPEWDVFISHASEDKAAFVKDLAGALQSRGTKVWYDDATLKLGDSLRRSIDRGLARSRFGVVVLSKPFLAKEWPQRELDGLVSRESGGAKVILPVWHGVGIEDVAAYSPTLADRVGISSAKGVDAVVDAILGAMSR